MSHIHTHGRTAPDAPIERCPRCAPLEDEISRLRDELALTAQLRKQAEDYASSRDRTIATVRDDLAHARAHIDEQATQIRRLTRKDA